MKRTEHKLVSAAQFFAKHGGFSYMPEKETPEQGKQRCADALAVAEQSARDGGFSFNWSIDPHCDSSEFSEDAPAWQLWQCAMYNADGQIVNSLHGVDFGRDGSPFGSAYRRVVEAELAIDGLTNAPQ